MAANPTLKKIIAEAKRIRKAHPKKFAKWTDYVKAASKNIKPLKKTANKKVAGWVKGSTHIIEKNEKKVGTKKNVRVYRAPKNSILKAGTFTHFASVNGLTFKTKPEIILTGVKNSPSLQKLIPEVKLRVNRGKLISNDVIKSPKDLEIIFRKFYTKNKIETQEYFSVMFLNGQNKVLGIYVNSMGTLNSTSVDVRLVLSSALNMAALGIVICHNHPFGGLIPSEADKEFTKQLKSGCKNLDIKLLDHIILTKEKYYSFAENHLL